MGTRVDNESLWARARRLRRRCDHLAPVEAEVGMATCVRSPGHRGPHRDRHGEEWPARMPPVAEPHWTLTQVARAAAAEVSRQDAQYGPFESEVTSIRLAVAALEDEVAEVLDAWRGGRRDRDWHTVREEAIQVAAVAMRLARDVADPDG